MIANLLLLGEGRGGRMCPGNTAWCRAGTWGHRPWEVIAEEAQNGSEAVDLAPGLQGCAMIRLPRRKLQKLFLRKVRELLWDGVLGKSRQFVFAAGKSVMESIWANTG